MRSKVEGKVGSGCLRSVMVTRLDVNNRNDCGEMEVKANTHTQI